MRCQAEPMDSSRTDELKPSRWTQVEPMDASQGMCCGTGHVLRARGTQVEPMDASGEMKGEMQAETRDSSRSDGLKPSRWMQAETTHEGLKPK